MSDAANEHDAFVDPTAWVDEYGDYLFRFAMLRVKNEELANDLVQETFLAALKGKETFAGQSAPRTWLVGILKHKIMDHFRKSSREVSLETNDGGPVEAEKLFTTDGPMPGHWVDGLGPKEWGGSPSEAIEKQEFWHALQSCLKTLPDRLAQVFVLRELDDADHTEITQTMNISQTNYWVMMHRARAQLRQCLEKNFYQGGISS